VQLDYIEPGKPMQNGHVESFNGKFRDECLNTHWSTTLRQARNIIHVPLRTAAGTARQDGSYVVAKAHNTVAGKLYDSDRLRNLCRDRRFKVQASITQVVWNITQVV
jgi:hypothetical protein